MADIQTNSKASRKGRSSLPAPRIDLTPMVDLGFLLITFFIFTTTMLLQKNMPIQLPVDNIIPTTQNNCNGLHLILGKGKKIFAYTDANKNNMATIQTMDSLYNTIALYKKSNKKYIINIEPTNESVLQNLVNVLDAVHLLQVNDYSITDVSVEMLDKIKSL